MDGEIAAFWNAIAWTLDRLVACVADLDEAQLSWRPRADGANSLRVLVVHTFGNVEETVLGQLGGEEVGRDRDSEFRAAAGTGAELADLWRALRPRLERTLAGLDRDALDRPHEHSRRATRTGREVLVLVVSHAAEHTGQAELTRDLLRQSSGSAASPST